VAKRVPLCVRSTRGRPRPCGGQASGRVLAGRVRGRRPTRAAGRQPLGKGGPAGQATDHPARPTACPRAARGGPRLFTISTHGNIFLPESRLPPDDSEGDGRLWAAGKCSLGDDRGQPAPGASVELLPRCTRCPRRFRWADGRRRLLCRVGAGEGAAAAVRHGRPRCQFPKPVRRVVLRRLRTAGSGAGTGGRGRMNGAARLAAGPAPRSGAGPVAALAPYQ